MANTQPQSDIIQGDIGQRKVKKLRERYIPFPRSNALSILVPNVLLPLKRLSWYNSFTWMYWLCILPLSPHLSFIMGETFPICCIPGHPTRKSINICWKFFLKNECMDSPQSLIGVGGWSSKAKRQLPAPRDCRCNIVLSLSLQGCPPWGTLLAFPCVGQGFHQQWSPRPEGCRAKQGASLMQWLHRD